MLGRVSGALHSAADLIAPPTTRLVDFQYHWKLIQNFYLSDNISAKVHVDNTRIPLHLDHMLQYLVDEETENPNVLGPCIEELTDLKLGIASCLTSLAEADHPPGLRSIVLTWFNSLLRRVKYAPIHKATLYRPMQELLIICNENHASPNEKEEVELLLTLCGLVRKQPELTNLFLSSNCGEDSCPYVYRNRILEKPQKNKLFEFDYIPNNFRQISLVTQPNISKPIEQTDCTDDESKSSECNENLISNDDLCDYNKEERFLLIDLLLSYLSSADNHIVLRACEGIMIVTSLPDEKIANLIVNTSSVCAYIIDKLIEKYKALPGDTDPCDIDQLNITWGYASQEFVDKCGKSIGLRETTSFLSWLDYCDTLAKECHPLIAIRLAQTLRWHFYVSELELGLEKGQNAVLITTVIGKCLKTVDSAEILNEMSQWLVGDCTNVASRPPSPIVQTLIHNCLEGEIDLCLETLRLFEVMLEKASEHILHCLVLGFLENRGYHSPLRPQLHPEDDERDRLNAQTLRQERESNRETMKKVCEGHIDGSFAQSREGCTCTEIHAQKSNIDNNIHHVINSFLLLLPRNLLSDPGGLGYEQYMQDAHRHYLKWVEATVGFNWPTKAIWNDQTASSTHSCDSRPEVDFHLSSNAKSKDSECISEANKSKDENIIECTNNSECKDHSDPLQVDGKNTQEPTEKECDEKCQHAISITDIKNTFRQQLVLSQRDRCSLSEMAEDDEMIFDEGHFLRALFKLLLNMPNQPYQINLQLTALFSKLAMMPHPYLHEYLLNPTLPTGKNVTTLFKSLQKLSKIFMAQIPKVKRFEETIEETRRRLLGDDSSEESEKSDPVFESLIVVEEFCKELAAIYFVKYHHSSQSKS